MNSPIVRFGRWLFAGMAILSAPVSGYFILQLFMVARASAAWPSVPGNVVRAEVTGSAFEHYTAHVVYKYAVAGRDYVGHRIHSADGSSDSREAAERELGGLTVGQQVAVYFDPAKPDECMLHTGAGFPEYAMLVIPFLVLAAGIGMIVWLRITRPERAG